MPLSRRALLTGTGGFKLVGRSGASLIDLVDGLRRIHAGILVDKAGQKAIVIGKGGEKLKQIATQARKDMEALFGGKVFLNVWVKVKSGWADDSAVLRRSGIE